jgi:hypothetical protein
MKNLIIRIPETTVDIYHFGDFDDFDDLNGLTLTADLGEFIKAILRDAMELGLATKEEAEEEAAT